MLKDYGLDVQRLFLEMMLEDASSYVRVQNIYNPQNFDKSLRPAAEFIKEHSDKHKTMPDRMQISATTGVKLAPVPDLNEGHYDWFMGEFESFTKRQELERAILKSADLLEKGEFEPVEKLIKDAVQISLTKDMGTDYFADPASRINKYFNSGGQVSTGWPQLDKLLYGGFSRGELNIFAGGSGSGKSLVMMNIALNWLQQGLSGVYITLELSEELT
jgi:replicative DNA helicase